MYYTCIICNHTENSELDIQRHLKDKHKKRYIEVQWLSDLYLTQLEFKDTE